ncbi:unnamed protein product, partial [marine sediment metagenome]
MDNKDNNFMTEKSLAMRVSHWILKEGVMVEEMNPEEMKEMEQKVIGMCIC